MAQEGDNKRHQSCEEQEQFMKSSPPAADGSEPQPPRRLWLLILSRTGATLSVLFLVGTVGALWWVWWYIHREITPLVARQLSTILQRPVEIGELEDLTLERLRFGPSAIPATSTDPDFATVEGVNVRFDLLRLLRTRTLHLDVTLIAPELYVEQAADGQWLDIQPVIEPGPIEVALGTIQVQNAEVALVPVQATGEVGVPLELTGIHTQAQFRESNQQVVLSGAGAIAPGGKVTFEGTANLATQAVDLSANWHNLLVADLDQLIPTLPIDLQAGQSDGHLRVQYRPDEPLTTRGTADFKEATLAINRVPDRITDARGKLRFQGRQLLLERAIARYGQVLGTAQGTIGFDSGLDLSIEAAAARVENLIDTLKIPLPVAVTGEADIDLQVTGPLNQPVLQGTVAAARQSLEPIRLDQRLVLDSLEGDFELDTAVATVDIANVVARPAVGGQIVGGGQVELRDRQELALSFQAQGVPGDAIAQLYGKTPPTSLGTVEATAQVLGTVKVPRVAAQWQLPEAIYPGWGEALIAKQALQLRNATFEVEGGTVTANGQITGGAWQIVADLSQIPLGAFSSQLRGQAQGRFNLVGNLDSFQPNHIRASGQIQLSEGLAQFNRPLQARVAWDGQKLQIQRASAPGLEAQGWVFARLDGWKVPAITGLDLNFQLQDYALRDLPLALPPIADVRGQADLSGQLQGTLTAPVFAGQLALENFQVNGFAFEPRLSGPVNLTPEQGTVLDLRGQQNRLEVVLDTTFQPEHVFVRRGDAIITGQARGRDFQLQARGIPLAELNLTRLIPTGFGPLAGELSGEGTLDFTEGTATGDVAIARPALGTQASAEALSLSELYFDLSSMAARGHLNITRPTYGRINTERFQGDLYYTKGKAVLTQGELQQDNSRVTVVGELTLENNPTFRGQAQLEAVQLQDILTALRWSNLADVAQGLKPPVYASARDLELQPVGLPDAALIDQVRRFSEVTALVDQATQRDNGGFLPKFADLQGNVAGMLNFSGSLQSGLQMEFNLQGEDWRWGRSLQARQVIAEGSYEEGVWTLLPLRMETDEAFLSFTGQLGGEQQSGQFRAQNVPVGGVFRDIVALPAAVSGNLNASATVAGSIANPKALGELNLSNGTLNGTPIELAQSAFSYADGRLSFGSTVRVEGPEPLRVIGSIPYRLPFATVAPTNNQLQLKVQVRNEGLGLLNALTDQVAWVNGQGSVSLNASGTLARPQLQGEAVLEGATIDVQALPAPLTEVTGTVLFNRDRIEVETLGGQFSEGRVTAQGVLPIFNGFSRQSVEDLSPLSVELSGLDVNLKGLYRGSVDGRLEMGGTALAPLVGGRVILSDGRILLPTDPSMLRARGISQPESRPGIAAMLQPPEFQNLQLQLANNVQITSQPLLSFLVAGQLNINGTLSNLQPVGTIDLRRGEVNLFASQFRLAPGYDNRATFEPGQGLDPDLDIRLITAATEINRSSLPSASSPAEISDPSATGLGGFQTVQIQASVTGPASELANNLELTSQPSRTEAEIISLLGGGFVDTLGRGDTTLAIANLAGSTLLGSIQNVIGNALGLNEFRLFPATILDEEEERESSSTLGIGIEAGVDLTDKFSVSIRDIINVEQDTQFNLRYRVNEELLLRTSTDFSGDTRGILEYETRF